MATLQIGQSILNTVPARDTFAELRAKYRRLGVWHQSQLDAGANAYKSIEDLFSAFATAVDRLVNETVDAAAADIASNQIYSVSRQTLANDLWSRVEAIGTEVGALQSAYASIVNKSAELNAQRIVDREVRSRVAGGGFGLEGAAQGMVIGAAANAAIGMVYGLANLGSKGMAALGDRKKKRALLEDPHTLEILGRYLIDLSIQGAELVSDIVNRDRNDTIYDTVSAGAVQKSQALLENIVAGRVPEAIAASVLIQAFELNPFYYDAWTQWIDKFGDPDGSVARSASALGIDLSPYKIQLYSRKSASLPWSTPEEWWENEPILENFSHLLGLNFDTERERIRSFAHKMDISRRTFNGVLHNSVEETDAAKAVYAQEQETIKQIEIEVRSRTFNGATYDTIDEMNEAKTLYSKKLNKSCLLIIIGLIFLCFIPFIPIILDNIWDNEKTSSKSPPTTAKFSQQTATPVATPAPQITLAPTETAKPITGVFRCPGIYSSVGFSEESGDGSGIIIKISSDRVERFDSWEGGVFSAETSVIEISPQRMKINISFPDFSEEKSEITLICNNNYINLSGDKMGNHNLKHISDEEFSKLNT